MTVDLLMADYAMTRLQPVAKLPRTTTPLPLNSSAAGRAFGAQEPHIVAETGNRAPTVTVHLPVSVRGDRLGVLSVTLPGTEPAPTTVEALQEIADALAHEIMVAERDTDLFLLARRAERLTLAAEMQWQLLPGRSCSRTEYSSAPSWSRPTPSTATTSTGPPRADHLTLTVNNGMGEGIDAALLTNLAVNALRNARRAGLEPRRPGRPGRPGGLRPLPGRAHLSMLLLRFHLPPAGSRSSTPDRPRCGACGQGASSRWNWRRSCRSACSRTPSTHRSTSRSCPATGSSSSATGSTTCPRRPANVQRARPDQGRARHPAAAAAPRCPGRYWKSSPAIAARVPGGRRHGRLPRLARPS